MITEPFEPDHASDDDHRSCQRRTTVDDPQESFKDVARTRKLAFAGSPLGAADAPTDAKSTEASTDHHTPIELRHPMTWAQRLKPVFNIDVNTCTPAGTKLALSAVEGPTSKPPPDPMRPRSRRAALGPLSATGGKSPRMGLPNTHPPGEELCDDAPTTAMPTLVPTLSTAQTARKGRLNFLCPQMRWRLWSLRLVRPVLNWRSSSLVLAIID
jgi:hypothetical protein